MQTPSKPARIHTYHNQKRNLLGPRAAQVPPAWRDQNPKDQGSKILLSRLPPDVGETEVEELFRKTVGPLKEVFLIYNSQGRSKGMAIVAFQRPGDAEVARAKYDGKFVDGRRPIKIEIIVDSQAAPAPPKPPPQAPPSLLNRLGGVVPANGMPANAAPPISAPNHAPNKVQAKSPQKPLAPRVVPRPQPVAVAAAPRRRQKKGPKRVKKSRAQLDQEMDQYRASVDITDVNGKLGR
ncbi:hypothetical protein SCLCIDRAFT_1216708 [Scleroderma citrinum Foug A]|uniref:RRM domain-containing protein n=1 Tax=Scleroderma citrinum Foug A TaxID=1036808 RepID=A0A0C3DIZ8_9AGAM|nr:hypothetical protein SCLCIDRAFT_1216708 [Scleroderma citrinum Foug A]